MGSRRSRLPSMVVVCVVYLVSVQAAPTSLPHCVPAINDTCLPGYHAAPCEAGNAAVSGCRPCPEATFSDTPTSITDKTSCRPRRMCDGPYMTYLWRGNSTSDSVCQCTTGYHLTTSYSCQPDGPSDTMSSAPTEGDDALEAPAYPAPWVGWVIVIAVTSAFIALMCVFWFWTPCLRGEPDYGDGQGAYEKSALHETEKLVSRDLSDEEDAVAVTYAVKRIPGLVPLTPKYTHEFLSALMKTASAAPEHAANGQSAKEELTRGLQQWQSDPSWSARYADLVEAMSSTGYGQKAQLLTQEVYAHLQHSNPNV